MLSKAWAKLGEYLFVYVATTAVGFGLARFIRFVRSKLVRAPVSGDRPDNSKDQ